MIGEKGDSSGSKEENAVLDISTSNSCIASVPSSSKMQSKSASDLNTSAANTVTSSLPPVASTSTTSLNASINSATSTASATSRAANRIGDFIATHKLGSGSFSTVYRAHHHQDKKLIVAIKAIRRDKLNAKLQKSLESEISILQKHRHDNIVKLFDIKKSRRHIYLVMEYCAGGDMHKFIRRQRKLSESHAKYFMRQLATGLHFMWKRKLIHRDLKPHNLLLTSPDMQATLKIADFGFARTLGMSNMAETMCGSPLYMAPEILGLKKYDAKADLWSVGTILFELLTGRPPFRGRSQLELLRNIQTQELRLPRDVHISKACVELLQGLLQRNPTMRMNFEEFFQSAFLAPRDAASAATATGSVPTVVPPNNAVAREEEGDLSDRRVDESNRRDDEPNQLAHEDHGAVISDTANTATTSSGEDDPPKPSLLPPSPHLPALEEESSPPEAQSIGDDFVMVSAEPAEPKEGETETEKDKPSDPPKMLRAETLESFKRSAMHIVSIARLAAEHRNQSLPSALPLYVKALQLSRPILRAARSRITPHANQPGTDKDPHIVAAVNFLQYLEAQYQHLKQRAKQCRETTTDTVLPAANAVIWRSAMRKGKDAAAQELLDEGRCLEGYESVLLLLDILLSDCHPSKCVEGGATPIEMHRSASLLEHWIARFQERKAAVESSLRRNTDDKQHSRLSEGAPLAPDRSSGGSSKSMTNGRLM